MCLPAAAAAIPAGMGLNALGTVINTREQNANSKRQVAAFQQQTGLEAERQAAYRARAQAALDRAIGRYAPGEQDKSLAGLLGQREQDITGNVTDAAPGGIPISKDAPDVVKTTTANKLNKSVVDARDSGKRLAALGARDDQTIANKMGFNTAARDIGTASNFAAASAGINPVEQMAAMRSSYRNPSGLGDLFKLFGQGASLYGFMGAPGLGGGASFPQLPGAGQMGGR